MKYLVIAMASLTAMTSAAELQGAIQIDQVGTSIYAFSEGASPGIGAIDTVPGTATVSSLGSSNTTTLGLTSVGGTTLLTHAIDQTYGASSYQNGADTSSWIYFTAAQDLAYSLSGTYSVTNASNQPADNPSSFTWLQVTLHDITAGVTLLLSDQRSAFTVNEDFTLGGMGGDSQNELSGALSGMLIKDHKYYLNVRKNVSAYPYGNSGVNALGYIGLSLAEESAVPEPAQLATWLGLGLCGVLFRRLRARSTVA